MSTEISNDAQAMLLDKQLNDLRTLRTNMKPWLAFIVGILFLILGELFVHGMFGLLLIVLGVAGLAAGATALAKRAGIDRQIVELQQQRQALNFSRGRGSADGRQGCLTGGVH